MLHQQGFEACKQTHITKTNNCLAKILELEVNLAKIFNLTTPHSEFKGFGGALWIASVLLLVVCAGAIFKFFDDSLDFLLLNMISGTKITVPNFKKLSFTRTFEEESC